MLALTRHVPAAFTAALCASPPEVPIDLARARAQHAAYRAALVHHLGLTVLELAADDALADCCFVEDTAVVADGIALVTRPGAPSRRGEVERVAQVLAEHVRVVRMTEPATLDGGDCMRVGSTIYVGRSARSNPAGIAQLAAAFPALRVVAVELPAGILHLKCVCAPLGPDRITLAEPMPDHPFAGLAIVRVPASESYAANVLAIGDRVIAAAGFPRTAEALERAKLTVSLLDTGEFRKADGALTCLSILVDPPSGAAGR